MRRAVLLAAAVLAAGEAPATAIVDLPDPLPAVAGNPADRLPREPIEAFRYDAATTCTPNKRRVGVERFTAWMDAEFRGVSWGTYRCEPA